MIETIFNPRIIDNKDWATILFVSGFALIAIVKTVFETRFNDFMNLIVSDKYIKIYRDSSHLMSGFTILLFIVQILSLAFFIQLALNSFGYIPKSDWLVFIQIATVLFVFILLNTYLLRCFNLNKCFTSPYCCTVIEIMPEL